MNNKHFRIPVAYTIKKDANTIEVLTNFRDIAFQSGWTRAQLDETLTEAASGDIKHVFRTLAKYCVAPSRASLDTFYTD